MFELDVYDPSMYRLVILCLVASCERRAPATKTDPVRKTLPADARTITSPDAAPAPAISTTAIPPELANAPASVFRRYYTGMITEPAVVTFTLRRHDRAVLLTVQKQSGEATPVPGKGPNSSGVVRSWTVESTTRYLGTAKDNVLSLIDVDKPSTLTLTCKNHQAAIARAGAVRKKGVPPKGGCEGEVGRFVPSATTRAELLYCYSAEPMSGAPDDGDWNGYGDDMHIALAPAPGVEWLYVNDDCSMQGGGFRWIAKDGAIANAR